MPELLPLPGQLKRMPRGGRSSSASEPRDPARRVQLANTAASVNPSHKVYIQFPPGVAQGETPPLFILGPTGEAELVNYRVRGSTYIVDRLFAAAELRLGSDPQQTVRISRTDAR